jgi:hypothetical protein
MQSSLEVRRPLSWHVTQEAYECDSSYGLKRYMDEGMLQPGGRVKFPIKLPPRSPAVDVQS